MIFLVLIAIAVAFEIAADLLLKKWALDSKDLILAVGLTIYFAGTVFWAFSLKYGYLSSAISAFTVLNLVAVALIGILYFKEGLSTLNKVGLILGILGVILIET